MDQRGGHRQLQPNRRNKKSYTRSISLLKTPKHLAENNLFDIIGYMFGKIKKNKKVTYELRNKHNEVKYIGETNNPGRRFHEHKKDGKDTHPRQLQLQ